MTRKLSLISNLFSASSRGVPIVKMGLDTLCIIMIEKILNVKSDVNNKYVVR